MQNKNAFIDEYFKFKQENLDSILLFQIGDFFETFFDDAKIFSQLTGTTLSTRPVKGIGQIPQAGFPTKSVEIYIKQLLDKDQKVALCLQFKDENEKCYRKIVRKYTKGTIVENEFLDSSENNHIAAIFKIDNNSISLCYSDISTGQIFKTLCPKCCLDAELAKIYPSEILVSKSQRADFEKIVQIYNPVYLDDNCFDFPTDEVIKNYCKTNQMAFCVDFNACQEYKYNNYMMLDQITRKCLELTRTRRALKKKGSIFWFLNYTKTPMGQRLLKKYISEPLLDPNLIKERQNALEEIISTNGSENIEMLQTIFENFCDLTRMTAGITNSTITPKDLLKIGYSAQKLRELNNACEKFKSKALKFNTQKLNRILDFADNIIRAIDENAQNDIKSGGIIASGYNSNLDYLKLELENLKQKLIVFEESEKNKLKIDNLKIGYSRLIGYYIEIPKNKTMLLGADYLRKQSTKEKARFCNSELQKLEEEIYNLTFKINELEYELYVNLRKYALSFSQDIRELSQNIAKLDCIVSLAKCAVINNLRKPNFNEKGIYIKNGFHPSLLKLKNEVVKNDTTLDNNSMIVLTGANMSGKSTFLKQNAVICLLAQIGSFVPADSTDTTIIDRLFIRQGSEDDIINNNSTFMVEMNDLKYILDNSTSKSLILLDEPAKSTNAQEGGAIARAFLEYILKYRKTKTITATHNLELTKMENSLNNSSSAKILNYVIGDNGYEGDMPISQNAPFTLNRKIRRGTIAKSCALNTAQLADLPEEIINNAKKYLEN